MSHLQETMFSSHFADVFPCFSRVPFQFTKSAGLSDGMSPRATNLEMEEDFKTEMCLIGMDEWDEPGLREWQDEDQRWWCYVDMGGSINGNPQIRWFAMENSI